MIALPMTPGGYKTILADPPWRFDVWSGATAVQKRGSKTTYTAAQVYYQTMTPEELRALPVASIAADNSVLFMWITWPNLPLAMTMIEAWGFRYKTCGFNWMKVTREGIPAMKMGYWTRASSEVCLLATRGKPKRLHADVRQGILAPIREHSRKPDGIHDRIERLVAGPYLELFARQSRPGWTVWGNESTKFDDERMAA